MKKKIEFKDGRLIIEYNFTDKHLRTLFMILANDGYTSFENRSSDVTEDMDGNDINWQICDDLVEVGLLIEDEEAFDIYYELTEEAKDWLKNKF